MILPANIKKSLKSTRAAFLIAGFGVASWAPLIPFVKDRFGLDEREMSYILFCLGFGAFCSMAFVSTLISHQGCKKCSYFATLIITICLFNVNIMPNVYLLGLNLFIFGMANVTLDIAANVNAARVEKDSNRSIMSGMHGLYSVGGFLGSIGVTLLLHQHLSPISATSIAILVMLSTLFCFCKDLDGKAQVKAESQNSKSSLKSSKKGIRAIHPVVFLVGALCFIMYLAEGAMLDWTGIFLVEEKGFALEEAGFGFASFAIAMTIFRLAGDKLIPLFGRRAITVLGSALIFAGFAIAVYVPVSIVALAGFALIGVGASNIVPQLISYVASRKETPSHIAITWANAFGYMGVLLGPAAIGYLAHLINLKNTFMIVASFVILVGVVCFYMLKHDDFLQKLKTTEHKDSI